MFPFAFMTWRSLNKNRKVTSKKKSKSPKNQIRNITEPGKQRLMYGSSLRSKDLLISDGNHAALGSFQYKVMAFMGHCSRMNSCDIPCIFGHRVRVRSGFRTHIDPAGWSDYSTTPLKGTIRRLTTERYIPKGTRKQIFSTDFQI